LTESNILDLALRYQRAMVVIVKAVSLSSLGF